MVIKYIKHILKNIETDIETIIVLHKNACIVQYPPPTPFFKHVTYLKTVFD